MKKRETRKVGVLGLWHLGSVYSACLAKLEFEVTGFDFDEKVISNLQVGKPSIKEPELSETIKKYSKNYLSFTSDPRKAIADKDYVFVTFDVPVNDQDKVNLKIIDKIVPLIQKFISPKTILVVSSQVPVGTSRKILDKVQKKQPTVKIIYFPENLRLGTAFESFLKPDRVVVGSDDQSVLEQFERDFSFLACPFTKIGLESAEMTKHAMNIYLATMISYSSEISDLCEAFGADMDEVVEALKTEKRISPKAPINPGLGFAGGTLGRDIQTLRTLSKEIKYKPLLLQSVYQVNRNRLPHLLKRLQALGIKNKTVGILGLTYKPFTDTLRRSLSLELVGLLKKSGISKLVAYDPAIKTQLKSYPDLKIHNNLDTFLNGTELIILMTEWPEFKEIEAKKLKNTLVVDTKNFFDKNALARAGVLHLRMGVA